jgi:hypothetical protein
MAPTGQENRTLRMRTWVTRRPAGRLLVVASAVGAFATAGAPCAAAEPIATCTSDVVDGVEVDHCVGNPNANTVTDVPRVNVRLDLGVGIG